MRRRKQGSARFLPLVLLSSVALLMSSPGLAQEVTAPPDAVGEVPEEAVDAEEASQSEPEEVLSEQDFSVFAEEAVEVEEPPPPEPEGVAEEPAEQALPAPEAEPSEVPPKEPVEEQEPLSEEEFEQVTEEAVEVEEPSPPEPEEVAEPPPTPKAEPAPTGEVTPTEPEEVHSEETFRDITEEAVEVEEPPPPSPPAEEPAAVKPEALPKPESEPGREPEDEPAPVVAIDPTARTVTFDRGLRIQRNDLQYRIKLGGRVMYDVAWIHGGKGVSAQFKTGFFNELRRGWTELTGTYGSRILYRVQVDMEGDSGRGEGRNRYFRQTFVAYTTPGSLRGVWVGMFKEPFSIGDGTGSLVTTFMERALPQAFVPSYNLGIMLKNETKDEDVTWRVGAFRYTGKHAGRDRLNLSGRVTAIPFAADEDRVLLHVGLSYSHQFRDDFNLRYRSRPETHVGDRFVDTGGFAVDGVDLLALELAGKRGPLSFQSEFVGSRSRLAGDRGTATFTGAYMQVSYFLTGEQRPYVRTRATFGRVRLRTQFSWKHRTWGAWEVAARFSYLDLDDGNIQGGNLNDATLGLNWYVSPRIRLMANFVRAHRKNSVTSNLFQMRFQIDY